jgi:hypothetical protein
MRQGHSWSACKASLRLCGAPQARALLAHARDDTSGVDDAEQLAAWARAEAELRASLAEMRPAIDATSATWVDEFLDHNELGLAMDTLVDAALASSAAGFPDAAIEHLRSASAQMAGYVPDTWEEFTARFG